MTTKAVHEMAPSPVLRYTNGAVRLRQSDTMSADENVWRWSGGDWRIDRAGRKQETRGIGQPAGLKRLALILRVEERLVKRYYRACASSMIQAG